MRLCYALLATTVAACAPLDDVEDLGYLGDGKADFAGIMNKRFSASAGYTRRFTFSASGPFEIRVTQPDTVELDRPPVRVRLLDTQGTLIGEAPIGAEPVLTVAGSDATVDYVLRIQNRGSVRLYGVLDVVAQPGATLPDPNAAEPPPADWQAPPVADWPDQYVIFNNTGCGHDCSREDQTALKPRSVMAKMILSAIDGAGEGSTIRVSNFNISSSSSVAAVADALAAAVARGVKVKVVMDMGQNTPTSKTSWLAQHGAEVRFLEGVRYLSGRGTCTGASGETPPQTGCECLSRPGGGKQWLCPAAGIMHSKMVMVDDEVVLTGSNNFSSSGFLTNEENSVVLKAPVHADRIAAFQCDFDTMFDLGVPPGGTTQGDNAGAIDALRACNTEDAWFPPSGSAGPRSPGGRLYINDSDTADAFLDGLRSATRSIQLAPDMLSSPSVAATVLDRARDGVTVRIVLDASPEALGNPSFIKCVSEPAKAEGLDVEVRYWPGNEEIFQLLHHKFFITDGDTLFNGSANFSSKALSWSFENVIRYRAGAFDFVVGKFAERFDRLFADSVSEEELVDEGLEVPDPPGGLGSCPN